jgi:hypothetical protein
MHRETPETRETRVGSSGRSRGTLIAAFLLLALLPGSELRARQAGETVKNKQQGISFRVPKGWVSIPVDPLDSLTIHKYQASRPDQAKKIPGLSMTASLELFFFRIAGARTADEEKTPDSQGEKKYAHPRYRSYEQYLEKVLRKRFKVTEKGRPSKKKINGMEVTKYDLFCEGAVQGRKAPPMRVRSAVFQTADGEFAMQFSCMDEHYKNRHKGGFDAAIHSFKRIEKNDAEDPGALSQLNENERYIQEQIEKLSSGWYYFWSRNKHYIIFSNADRDFANKISAQLEAVHDRLGELFPGPFRVKWIPIVRVCKTANEYYGYGGPKGSSGYWWDLTKEFVFYKNVALGEKLSFETLRHEAFHHFIHFYLGCLPSTWFDEGHADYFGGAQLVGKRLRIKPRQGRRDSIQKALVQKAPGKRPAPLKAFLHMTKQEYYSKPGLYYAQGWSFIFFLREGKREGARVLKAWQSIPERYLAHLKQAFAELEAKHPDKVAGTNEVNAALSAQAVRLAMERTFEGWTEKDWKELEKAWLDFIK